ncbi:hypothetical protein J6590_052692 [Homalodisca vitripennis]|nr:hypothetical protein J6590_052692 [Homalodisca vitripennis]
MDSVIRRLFPPIPGYGILTLGYNKTSRAGLDVSSPINANKTVSFELSLQNPRGSSARAVPPDPVTEPYCKLIRGDCQEGGGVAGGLISGPPHPLPTLSHPLSYFT